VCPARHSYPVGVVQLFVQLVLSAAASLRSATAVLQLLAPRLPLLEQVPCVNSGRGWLLRIGLFQLTREKPQAEDWVWIRDHTLQLGPYKCLIIVGNRTKLATTQTCLAFLTPPGLASKARYMNLDTLVSWGVRALDYLDSGSRPEEPSVDHRNVQEKLGWLRCYR
jgi:hypothetical protein